MLRQKPGTLHHRCCCVGHLSEWFKSQNADGTSGSATGTLSLLDLQSEASVTIMCECNPAHSCPCITIVSDIRSGHTVE